MKTWLWVVLLLASLGTSGWVHADSTWSAADYDLYPGDFNGDGLTDLLYISKDPARPSGIVLSDGTGLNTPLQSWANAYLGIPWTDGSYNVIVADFDGDGRADLFLQRKTPGDNFLLLTEDGGVGAISQTIPYDAAGLAWSADQHEIVAGDFNGDGKADLYLQPTDAKGLSAILLADEYGQFSAKAPDQSWDDGYAGLNWAANEVQVFAGDFDGDGKSDLLVQALPMSGTGPGTSLPAQFQPNSNGVLLALSGKQLFALEGLQAWNRDGFGADWSPLDSVVVIGDFNADGRSDVFLQGATSYNPNYLLYGHAPGAIFSDGAAIKSDAPTSADTYRVLAGNFTQDKGYSLYFQSLSPKQANYAARISGSAISVTQPDASLAASTDPLAADSPSSPSAMAALTVTSAGRTPGQFAVSAMGAATYQIPIWTPPGARGIEPKLALVYGSGSPDGMMGPGWNLSGLSSITRCNKTYAENGGVPAGVTLTTSDDFCLDGNRLRVTSGTYGASGSVYQTEIANFSRVTANGTAGNGPSYFIVEGKDGLIYEYGNTVDSKAYATSGSTPYAWMLNKVRDRQTQADNMTVTYSTTSGAVQPASIQYTQTPSTNGTTYPYTVSFTYQNRLKNLSRYVSNLNIQQTQVLAKINVQSSGTSVRQFTMTYQTAPTTQRDRLYTIQECAGSLGTDCLRPTTVTYQNGALGVGTSSTTLPFPAGISGSVYYDFNGDGKPDLLYSNAGTYYVMLSTPTGFASAISTGVTAPVAYGDVLGAGQDGIVANNGSALWYYTYNGTAFSGVSLGAPALGGGALVDTQGNGRPNLITLGALTVRTYQNTSSGSTPSFNGTPVSSYNLSALGFTDAYKLMTNYNSIRSFDFDGDGRKDIVVTGDYTCGSPGEPDICAKEAELVVVGAGGTAFSAGPTFSAPLGSTPVLAIVNWNADACTDLILASGAGKVYVSPCSTGTPIQIQLPTGTPIGVMDWNDDGQSDLLVQNGTTIGVYLSTGIGASALQTTTIPYSSLLKYGTLDVNGDGLEELITSTTTSVSYYAHAGFSTPPDLATTIADGWNISATPTYASISLGSYTKGTAAVYPESDINAPIYVVSQAAQSDGIGGTFTNTFWYWGAVVERRGRGFEGFLETRSRDSRNLIYQYVVYNQSFPRTGTVSRRDTYRPDNTNLMARITNHFTVTDLSAGQVGCSTTTTNSASRCFPYLDSATTISYELTAGPPLIQTSVATFSYDTNGNVLTAQTATTDNDSNSPNYNNVWTSLTTNTYGTTNTTTWCLDKPTRTTTQNSITGQSPAQPTLTRTVDHAVDTTYCRFTSETTEPTNSTLKAVSNFGYDSCGNVNSVGVVGLDQNGATMPTRTTTSNYGTRCTFPESVTNALTQTATIAYNYSYGVKSSSTDPNGVSVSWLYDQFGRKSKENRPDSTYSTWAYEDCITVGCSPTLGTPTTDDLHLKVTETRYDSAGGYVTSAIKYADGMERVKYEAGYRVLGTLTWTKTTFDSLGRKVDTYLPYATTSNGFHEFTYDLLNRPTIDKLYDDSGAQNRQTQMTYAGLKTTITDARGNDTSKWTDVAGKLRRIIDPAPGGTTNYTLDVFGNLAQLVDATGQIITYKYNIRGFKFDSVDPDTGHWIYTPNSLNELIAQIDAKSQNTGFVYDKLGRKTSRTDPEGTTSWIYGTAAASHNIGRLQCVLATSASNCNATSGIYREDYAFDSFGRPSTTTIVEDTSYTIGYAYNAIGAVDTVTYPASTGSPFKLKYLYSYGAVQQVKDNAAGTVFWTLSATNDSSLPKTELLGNGVTVGSTYTPYTNELVTRKEGTGGVSNSLQDLAYQWDLNGNLYQRKDQKQLPNLTETFVHDTLNRISSSTLNGATNLSVNYDEAGNITNKSDVGTYDYTAIQSGCTYQSYLQPHAVRKAGTAVYCYDANGNVTNRGGSSITWFSYNLPNRITKGSSMSAQFNYNPNYQRWKQISIDTTGTSGEQFTATTYYIGGIMEKVVRPSGVTEYRHLIPAGSGSAILTRRSDLTSSTYYTTSDHLGSGDLVLDSSHNVLVQESFTPFGARRGANWQGTPTQANYTAFSNTTRRGFTGHEMLDSVGLVHMNGRVYDPTIGRFLSADPIIQTLALSQALNPFSYVMNMPLTLTDPSGLSWLSKLFSNIGHFLKKYWTVILSVVLSVFLGPFASALIMWAINGGNFESFAIGLAVGMVAGAIAGPLGNKIGAVVGLGGKGLVASVLRGAIVGGIAGGISSVATGGNFGAGFAGGAIGGALTAAATWRPESEAAATHEDKPATDSKQSESQNVNKNGASDPGDPAHMVVVGSRDNGPNTIFDYQVTDAQGNALTGDGYSWHEHIDNTPRPGEQYANGNDFPPIRMDQGVAHDAVGYAQYPTANVVDFGIQRFTVWFHGPSYSLSTVFMHVSVFTLPMCANCAAVSTNIVVPVIP